MENPLSQVPNILDPAQTRLAELPLTTLYREAVLGKKHVAYDTWHTAPRSELPEDENYNVLFNMREEANRHWLLGHNNELVAINIWATEISVTVASKESLEAAQALIAKLKAHFQPAEEEEEKLDIRFWFGSKQGGGKAFQRRLVTPDWSNLRSNYAARTRNSLDQLMGFDPTSPGQLLLWTGKPGTGKTFALRSLAYAWREWCRIDVILDPERFLGDGEYLASSLLRSDADDVIETILAEEGIKVKPKPTWRMLVLEDAGELIAEDAKAETGQGLSRLLNLTDGLLGQGLQILTMITTNEEIKDLHPAIARPGRCASSLLFEPLSAKESKSWLEKHNLPSNGHGEQTLADLYAKLNEESYARMPKAGEAFGFAAGR